MEATLIIMLKTLIIYIYVTAAMRFMGKRQIGELSASEIVVALLISEIATMPIDSEDVTILQGFAAIAILVILEILISYLDLKFPFIMKMSHGIPTVIIYEGKISEKMLKKSRLTVSELNEELRLKNTNIKDVYIAIIETNGQISIIPKNNASQNNSSDKNGDPVDFAVIIDGKIKENNLKLIGKEKSFIENELKKRKIPLKNVFVMYADKNGVTFFQKKEKRTKL